MEQFTSNQFNEHFTAGELDNGVYLQTGSWCKAPCEAIKSSIKSNGINVKAEVCAETNTDFALVLIGKLKALPMAICIKDGEIVETVSRLSSDKLYDLTKKYK